MLWFSQFIGDRSKCDAFLSKRICQFNYHHKFTRQITYFSHIIIEQTPFSGVSTLVTVSNWNSR